MVERLAGVSGGLGEGGKVGGQKRTEFVDGHDGRKTDRLHGWAGIR